MESLFKAEGFDWDEHNTKKIWKKHGVKFSECEEAFFDPSHKVAPDETHSQQEKRCFILGRTKEGRRLFVAFTERRGKIRVISARNMSRRERKEYNEKI